MFLLNISEAQKKILKSLLLLDFECGGIFHFKEMEITSFEIYAGEKNFVQFPQSTPCRNHYITFHTHPRGPRWTPYLPPSPSDIIMYTLANSYIYSEIHRTSLVCADEGVYIQRVVKQLKPNNMDLKKYLQETYTFLVELWTRYERNIYTKLEALQELFKLIEAAFGIHIELVSWENLKHVPADLMTYSNLQYMDFPRNILIADRQKYAHLTDMEFEKIFFEAYKITV